MKKVAIIQARMGSARFPGKVLEYLRDKPILEWVIDAVSQIPMIDEIVVAAPDKNSDDPIEQWCTNKSICVFRGNEDDVLTRYYEAANFVNAGIILRITADCPLLDPNIAGQVLYLVTSNQADYATNTMPPTWPDGLDCEAFTFKALEDAFISATSLTDREHVTSHHSKITYRNF